MTNLHRFRNGDPDAVRDLYGAYARPVFSIAYRSLGNRALAEEAVQQTFLQAWRGAHRIDPERDIGPWLYTIARRAAIDLYRRERRHRSDAGDEPEMAVLPSSFEDMWTAWEVRTALEALPEAEREVLRATHYLGYTHQETAELLGIPIGTVKSRTHRAHRKLAEALEHIREATA